VNTTAFQSYLERFIKFAPNQSGPERMAHCLRPENHRNGDRDPSMSVNVESGLFCCHSCGFEANIYQAAEQFGWPTPPGGNGHRSLPTAYFGDPISTFYRYDRPDDGSTAYYVARVETVRNGKRAKQFPLLHPDGKWAGKKNPLRERYLFRLPAVIAADDVFLVEGEKDVQTIERLGLTATTAPGGAGKWDDSFNEYLKNKNVVVIPDNDEPGRRHAGEVARSLHGLAASVKILELPDLPLGGDVSDWVEGKDPVEAGEELCRLADRAEEYQPESDGPRWSLVDLADFPSIQVEPLRYIVEPLIPVGGIGFLSGAPKDGKSLLAIDLIIHMAQRKPWLGRFETIPARTLYMAREDPLRRLKERIIEINESYAYGPLPGGLVRFIVRERFNLMDESHIIELGRLTEKHGFEFLVLDVLNRMVPGLDELLAKDMAAMVSVLENLNRDLGLTILLLDHTRKPVGLKSSRNNQEPNPFDLKGSVAKYGAADFMICLSRTEQPGRLQLYCENKDDDGHPHFLIDVSSKDSGQPKFVYGGDIETLGEDRKMLGQLNRNRVLGAVPDTWTSASAIREAVELSRTAVYGHLISLTNEGLIEREGIGKLTRYRRLCNREEICLPNTKTEDQCFQ